MSNQNPNYHLYTLACTMGGYNELKYVKRDQENLTKVLKEKYGFFVHKGDPSLRAGYFKEQFQDELEEIKNKNEPHVFIFYYTGHGAVWEGELYLYTNHSDHKKKASQHGIRAKDVVSFISDLGITHRLFIFDCCNAGALDGIKSGADVAIEKSLPSTTFVYASRKYYNAHELDELKGSFLTSNLVAYLQTNDIWDLEKSIDYLQKQAHDWNKSTKGTTRQNVEVPYRVAKNDFPILLSTVKSQEEKIAFSAQIAKKTKELENVELEIEELQKTFIDLSKETIHLIEEREILNTQIKLRDIENSRRAKVILSLFLIFAIFTIVVYVLSTSIGLGDKELAQLKDTDNDGIPDKKDICPKEKEDKDGFQDNDGCIDIDVDKDKIKDEVDSCPNSAEDYDNYQDGDGCPDIDNDNDGIPDEKDNCRDVVGIIEENGCKPKDTDNDGIPDKKDICPNKAETVNGVEDEDGCPEKKQPNSKISKKKKIKINKEPKNANKSIVGGSVKNDNKNEEVIIIDTEIELGHVQFDKNTWKLTKRAEQILTLKSKSLKQYQQALINGGSRVAIYGYRASKEAPEVSNNRAIVVRNYLIKIGVLKELIYTVNGDVGCINCKKEEFNRAYFYPKSIIIRERKRVPINTKKKPTSTIEINSNVKN